MQTNKVWNPKTLTYESQGPKASGPKDSNTDKGLKFDTAEILTKKDTGKMIQITTITNNIITGKLLRTAQYELELETTNQGKLIVYKHSILSIRILN